MNIFKPLIDYAITCLDQVAVIDIYRTLFQTAQCIAYSLEKYSLNQKKVTICLQNESSL